MRVGDAEDRHVIEVSLLYFGGPKCTLLAVPKILIP